MNIQDQLNLRGKVAIVTGASQGIGRAIAQVLVQQGASVVVASRKQSAVDAVAAQLTEAGGKATGIAAHMGEPDQIENLVQQTQQRYGGVDIVVNNAATNPVFGPVTETDDAVFAKIMQVNVNGPLALAKFAYPLMKERGGGSVINVSSVEGLTPGAGLGLYSVSKSALIALTKVLAREWGADQVRANVICPGLVNTKFSQALISNERILKQVLARQALPQVAEPEEIAGLALFLASDAASFCTGGVYVADGGYTV